MDDDPSALVGTPKREKKLPAHLAEQEMSRLLETPDLLDTLRPPRPGHSRAVLRLRPSAERARWSGPRRRQSLGARRACARQGREGARRPVQQDGSAGDQGLACGFSAPSPFRLLFLMLAGPHPRSRALGGAAPPRFPPAPRAGRRRFSSTIGAGGSRREAWTGSCGSTLRSAARGSGSARMHCAIPLRRTCFSAERIYGLFRNCSATRACPPRSATRTSTPRS